MTATPENPTLARMREHSRRAATPQAIAKAEPKQVILPEFDTALGEIKVGSKFWQIEILKDFIRSKTINIMDEIKLSIRLGEGAEHGFKAAIRMLKTSEFPPLAEVQRLRTTQDNRVEVTLKRAHNTSIIRLSGMAELYCVPDFEAEVRRYKRLADNEVRQHEKKKAAIEQEFANELREAKATIAQDAALNPAIRSARARMPQYAARIKSAAEIVNRAAK
jgi:hypothetical protein